MHFEQMLNYLGNPKIQTKMTRYYFLCNIGHIVNIRQYQDIVST